jgi:hypothetical protein
MIYLNRLLRVTEILQRQTFVMLQRPVDAPLRAEEQQLVIEEISDDLGV